MIELLSINIFMLLCEFLTESHYHYVGNCTNRSVEDGLREMMDRAVPVSYRVLVRAVGRDTLAEYFPQFDWSRRPHDLTMKNDYAVSYYRSVFKGRPCYYVRESGIEHIFAVDEVVVKKSRSKSGIYIEPDGSISPTPSKSIFTIQPVGDARVELTQSSAATPESARALADWLKRSAITMVNDDGEDKPVEEILEWLAQYN